MTRSPPPPRRHWRLHWRTLANRPRLLTAAAVGGGVTLGLLFVAHLRASTGLIVGWDAFCLVFLAAVVPMAAGQGPQEIAARAATQDEGQGVILLLVLGASAASLAAVAAELLLVKGDHRTGQGLHVALALGTVGASWLVMQTILALHYAHEYYAPDAAGAPAGGLTFPGAEAPDYWDFLHFSIVIGVAAQTADIAIADRRLRRLATVHSLIAFVFNTLIIALAINLLAGLF
jgi:uncharacterized membrane protein